MIKMAKKKAKQEITPEIEKEIQKQVEEKTKPKKSLLESGKKVRRPSFREGSYLIMKDDKLFNQLNKEVILGQRDIDKDDWIEFE